MEVSLGEFEFVARDSGFVDHGDCGVTALFSLSLGKPARPDRDIDSVAVDWLPNVNLLTGGGNDAAVGIAVDTVFTLPPEVSVTFDID